MLCKDVARPLNIKDILQLLDDITEKRQEHFAVITLNNGNEVIDRHIVFIGTANAAIVHPREVFACALKDNAVGVIVAHNHPSNDPTPSKQDIIITEQLSAAGDIIGIKLKCHLIVARDGYRII